jgi:hypothetical protein
MTHRFARMLPINLDLLSPEEIDELDTLQFRKCTDLPFGPDDEQRMGELVAKATPKEEAA